MTTRDAKDAFVLSEGLKCPNCVQIIWILENILSSVSMEAAVRARENATLSQLESLKCHGKHTMLRYPDDRESQNVMVQPTLVQIVQYAWNNGVFYL
jgi:hypothetical protein